MRRGGVVASVEEGTSITNALSQCAKVSFCHTCANKLITTVNTLSEKERVRDRAGDGEAVREWEQLSE